jgi:hypothetical protein
MSISSIMSGNDDPPAYPAQSPPSSKASHRQPPYIERASSPPPVPLSSYRAPPSPKPESLALNGNSVKVETNGHSSSIFRPNGLDISIALDKIPSSLKTTHPKDMDDYTEEFTTRGSKRIAAVYGDESKRRKVSHLPTWKHI